MRALAWIVRIAMTAEDNNFARKCWTSLVQGKAEDLAEDCWGKRCESWLLEIPWEHPAVRSHPGHPVALAAELEALRISCAIAEVLQHVGSTETRDSEVL